VAAGGGLQSEGSRSISLAGTVAPAAIGDGWQRPVTAPRRGERGRVIKRLLVVCTLVAAFAWATQGAAQSLIRDAEIEADLRRLADPIFAAAGLDPGSVRVFVVNDPSLNAFVAGGQNLFINTGLITRAQTPEQLAGVIAHETGHISGGHLSRLRDAVGQANTEAIIGALLGAAAIVAGAPQVGTAMMAGGATYAERNLLRFSRGQEQAADQAAIRYLAAKELPPTGLYEFFKILETQNLRIHAEGPAYLRTHPLTRDRITFLAGEVERSAYVGRSLPPEAHAAHALMVAKIEGFLGDPMEVLARRSGTSFEDRYARAVATFRRGDVDQALELVHQLQAERPGDPYLHEVEGQILFESGRIAAAVPAYRDALAGVPQAALVRFGLARALLELNEPESTAEAVAHFREVVRLEPENAFAWRFLGIAEGRSGNEARASLALAEHAVLVRKPEDAQLHLRRARQTVQPGGPDWLHLQDLEQATERLESISRG
jgi:predicted Zn-dependent protease